jgi:hypothetical protein
MMANAGAQDLKAGFALHLEIDNRVLWFLAGDDLHGTDVIACCFHMKAAPFQGLGQAVAENVFIVNE